MGSWPDPALSRGAGPGLFLLPARGARPGLFLLPARGARPGLFLLPACGEKVPKADEGQAEWPPSDGDVPSAVTPRTPHPAALRAAVPLPASGARARHARGARPGLFLLPACGEKVPKADEGQAEWPPSDGDVPSAVAPRTPHPAALRAAVPLPASGARARHARGARPGLFLLPACGARPGLFLLPACGARPGLFLLPACGEKVPAGRMRGRRSDASPRGDVRA